MLLWFVKIYERNLKKLQFTTQRVDTPMLTCISLIDDVTTQSRALKETRYSAKITPDENTVYFFISVLCAIIIWKAG